MVLAGTRKTSGSTLSQIPVSRCGTACKWVQCPARPVSPLNVHGREPNGGQPVLLCRARLPRTSQIPSSSLARLDPAPSHACYTLSVLRHPLVCCCLHS